MTGATGQSLASVAGQTSAVSAILVVGLILVVVLLLRALTSAARGMSVVAAFAIKEVARAVGTMIFALVVLILLGTVLLSDPRSAAGSRSIPSVVPEAPVPFEEPVLPVPSGEVPARGGEG